MRRKLLVPTIALLLVCLGAEGAAQTCRDDIAPTTPDSRFQDNGNGTVTDLATGLIWMQCPEGLSGAGCGTDSLSTFTWQEALQHAADNPPWRLPNKNELASLVELRCHDPAINARFFPNTPLSTFWSSSPYAFNGAYGWGVSFKNGDVSSSWILGNRYVRLVRGGP